MVGNSVDADGFGVERAVEEIEPVLPPEALAVQDVGRGAEDAEALGFVAVGLVQALDMLAFLRKEAACSNYESFG